MKPQQQPKQPHEWITMQIAGHDMPVCGACGIVRRRDGANETKECRGPVRIVARKEEQQSATSH